MPDSRSFLFRWQRPRFRDSPDTLSRREIDFPVADFAQLHALCGPCKHAFGSSKVIHGSVFRMIPSWEKFPLHESRSELEQCGRNGCHFCNIAVSVLDDIIKERSLSESSSLARPLWIKLTYHSWRVHLVVEFDGVPSEKYDQNFNLENSRYQRSPISDFPGNLSGCSTSSVLHMNLARQWIDGCTKNHQACKRRSGVLPIIPARLIYVGGEGDGDDIHLQPTSELGEAPKYCALSHCWGGATDILTLKVNNKDQLHSQISFDSLPKTFQDAVSIVRGLGYRYLWIDSLCIIQDSSDDWATESAVMGAVYENAICTIAAAASDNANGGCFVSRNPLAYRSCRIAGTTEDGLFVHQRNTVGNSYSTIDHVLSSAPISKRAWVFQEKHLSPRTLHFGEREMMWRCRHGSASEQYPDGFLASNVGYASGSIFGPKSERGFAALAESKRSTGQPVNLLTQDVNELTDQDELLQINKAWFGMVSEYASRELTYDSDKLVALSGIARRIQERTSLEYLGGLWRQSLLYDLLWYVVPRERQSRPDYRAPTWSWASVNGAIRSRADYSIEGGGGGRLFKRLSWYDSSRTEVEQVHVTTNPLDTAGTGKVSGGELTLKGVLHAKRYTFRPNPAKKEDIHIVASDGTNVGTLHHDTDVIPANTAGLSFLVLFQGTLLYENYNKKVKHVATNIIAFIGLVLRRREVSERVDGEEGVDREKVDVADEEMEVYERVGLFEVLSTESDTFPRYSRWDTGSHRIRQRSIRIV